MKIKLINNVKNLEGKRVFVRIDANVKVGSDRRVDSKEDFKLQRVLPTIQYLVDKGAIVILASHLGRPEGKRKASLTLQPIANRFTTLLGKPIHLCSDSVGPKAAKFVAGLKPGQVGLLENLRFYPGEDKNDLVFAKKLADLADIYVNDAFAFCHRPAASMVAITKYLPSFAGFLLFTEITQLSQVLKKPKKPFITILGGVKISTKIKLVKKFADISDYVLIGGGLANNFLLADGYKIGASLIEKKYLLETKRILKQYKKKILLPIDVTVDNIKTKKIETMQKSISDIKSFDKIIDIGTQTVQEWSVYIKKAKTIVWNGPLGVVEDKKASHASRALAELIASRSKRSCYSVVGGGETVWLLQDMGIFEDFDYVSTGGGAMIEYLQGHFFTWIKSSCYQNNMVKKQKGFTLIELLVVIGIIAVLATFTAISVRSAREKAKVAKAQNNIDVLYTGIGQLMVDTGEWPGHQTPDEVASGSGNEVWDLAAADAGLLDTDGAYLGWSGPYVAAVPIDPWGNNYFLDTDYSVKGNNQPCDGDSGCRTVVAIGSFGPDGIGQNQYNGDDIIKIIR